MGEREPQQPRSYSFEYQGEEIVLNYQNTVIFLHVSTPEYDHVYVQIKNDSDEEERGFYLWRETQTNFDLMVNDLTNSNCSRIVNEFVSETDLHSYNERFGQRQVEQPKETQKQPEEETVPELDWISKRRELELQHAVEFIIYLAQNDKLD